MSNSIYLYPDTHTYKDKKGRTYISVTTLLGRYEPKFDDKKYDIANACEKIGRNPSHPKFDKYRGKTAEQLICEWEAKSIEAAAKGTEKHGYFEDSINGANGFGTYVPSKKSKDFRIYTLDEVFDSEYGELNITLLPESLKVKYPRIYYTLEVLMNHGYWIFAEVCVFLETPYLISGLVDIFAVNKTNKHFIILDWKTNKKPIRFEPGYWDTDKDGNIVGWVNNDDRFKYPISIIPYSIGYKFTLQVSTYAYLAECMGYTCEGMTIFNTPDIVYGHDTYSPNEFIVPGNPVVNVHPVKYFKKEVINIISDYTTNRRRS